jgi:thymidylate synthase
MLVHETESLRTSYYDIAREILDKGAAVHVRGRDTFEVSPAVIACHNPLDALPTGTGRGVVKALAVVEALSLVAGEADARLFVAASPHYAKFVEPLTGDLDVAYGPRLDAQMAWAETRLREDPHSRQAHVSFWRNSLDRPGLRAYPCVVSCGFTIRDHELECYVEMRSNDVWLGLPYDAFAFGQLQATLANVLGAKIGFYYHYARSLHIYADDAEKASELFPPKPEAPGWTPGGLKGSSWAEARHRAREILHGDEPHVVSATEWDFLKVMREKVLPNVARA